MARLVDKEEPVNPKKISYDEAKLKAAVYCAYQERCQEEVKVKLYGYGLYTNQVNDLLSYLITENYINEERFSMAYAGGKFRVKHWGRIRIKHELQKRKISEYCIRKGMEEIGDEEYIASAKKLILKKKDQLTGKFKPFQLKNKIAAFTISKGYEPGLIWDLINDAPDAAE
jgi:regulatory protein